MKEVMFEGRLKIIRIDTNRWILESNRGRQDWFMVDRRYKSHKWIWTPQKSEAHEMKYNEAYSLAKRYIEFCKDWCD